MTNAQDITERILPKSHRDATIWAELVQRQKAFRLASLHESPTSFSSTYERESAFSDAEWVARLRNPFARTMIASRPPFPLTDNVDPETAVLDEEWLGMAVLFGPKQQRSYRLQDAVHEEDKVEVKKPVSHVFEIFGLYIVPDARECGTGKRLMEALVELGWTLGKQADADEVVIRVSHTEGNLAARRLFERVGFTEVAGTTADESNAAANVKARSVAMEIKRTF
jgi:GNAT superfamily N-acetyltransferase